MRGDCREHDGQVQQASGQWDRQLEEPQCCQQAEAAWQIDYVGISLTESLTYQKEHELLQGTEEDKTK